MIGFVARISGRAAAVAALIAAFGTSLPLIQLWIGGDVAVAWTAPDAAAAIYGFDTELTVTATSSNAITDVAFSVDDVVVARDTVSPYTVSLDTLKLADGSRTLKATATDDKGFTSSTTRTVTVVNDDYFYALNATPSSTGTTYYVSDCQAGADADCIAGNDENNGTSSATPWQTVEKVRTSFGAMGAGAIVLFAKGASVTAAGGYWGNTDCTAANPCKFDQYVPPWASGNEAAPIITSSTGGAFDFYQPTGQAGLIVRNLHLVGGGVGVNTGFGIRVRQHTGFLAENLTIEGFKTAIYPDTSPRSTIRDSVFQNNWEQGVFAAASDYLIVEDNTFTNNGFNEAVFDHNLYLASSVSTTYNNVLRRNSLYQSCLIDGTCQGVSLVVHGIWDGLLIEGNAITEDIGGAGGGCWGIGVDMHEAVIPGEGFLRLIIRANTITNVGNLGIGITSGPNAIVEDNVIIQEQTAFGFTGIRIPSKPRGADDLADTGAKIRNNSIYLNNGTSAGSAIWIDTEGTGYGLSANAIHYAAAQNTFNCFDLGLASTAYASDYNLCYAPSATVDWENGTGSLVAWQAASGLDAHSLTTDPKFADLTGPAYSLDIPSDSPCVNAGDPALSSTTDLEGYTRADPDIGAYEYH